jgi:hypothetical protein
MLVSSALEYMSQNEWAYETFPSNTSQNINWELLLMSGLICTVWVYVTSNVHVMEF